MINRAAWFGWAGVSGGIGLNRKAIQPDALSSGLLATQEGRNFQPTHLLSGSRPGHGARGLLARIGRSPQIVALLVALLGAWLRRR